MFNGKVEGCFLLYSRDATCYIKTGDVELQYVSVGLRIYKKMIMHYISFTIPQRWSVHCYRNLRLALYVYTALKKKEFLVYNRYSVDLGLRATVIFSLDNFQSGFSLDLKQFIYRYG